MGSHTILASNALGEVHACPCGGVHVRLAGTMVHVIAQDIAKLAHLSTAALAHSHMQQTSAPTPSHSEQAPPQVAQMTPEEAARFSTEGPIRTAAHQRPASRTLH